ncbi:MAG: HAD-IC family P-type ATPase [Oscillospiraceae bacterium]|nr:HAD-IC family P-type ATPase [Oscillospiraceae bacterium]
MGFLREIKQAVSGHGHDCTCDSCMEEHHHEHHGFDTVMVWRLVAAAVLFIGGEVAEGTLPTVSLILFIVAILCAGYDLFIGAVANIFQRKLFDETLLMSIVAIAACIIGEAGEGASVMILFQLGELFQGYAVAKVRRNIEGLMENRSPEASAVLADVRADKGRKGRTEEFITHFSRVYTPVVLGIALIIAIVSPLIMDITVAEGVHRALVLLVIACPCAIVISVPLTYFAGIGGATRQGILFKNTCAMDDVARTQAVVFDKTGALEGEGLRVVSIKSDKMDADVFLRIAAHACAYSSSIYAEGIKASYQGVIYIELIQSFHQQEEGFGITVEVDGVSITLGLLDFMRDHGADPGLDALPEDYCVYLAIDGQYAGRILLGSVAKSDAYGTVTILSWAKDREIAMITDDSRAASEKFARQVGIDEFYPECHPSDKVALVKEIQNRQVKKGTLMFVGDAETDGDCIRQADVGVSMNGADSDAAIQAADVVIMDNSPSKVVTAMEAARHTRSIVWQNIVFALTFKVIILVLDMFGSCPLWLAVFADVGVALLAVLNSLRAFLLKDTVLPEEK